MTLRPPDKEALAASLCSAHKSGNKVRSVDLSAMGRILRHTPEDMTAKVEAGVMLGEFQRALARNGQWLPIDPPSPDALTIGALIAGNANGPRRYGFGTIRDHLIGLEVALADGRLVKSGGNVVKNVAGYDLMKLFIGARDSLGIVVEASFKLLPLPEEERFLRMTCQSLEAASQTIESIIDSELTPVVFDLYRAPDGGASAMPTLVVGFAGRREDVEWQVGRAAALGLSEPTSLDYQAQFWSAPGILPRPISVVPSRLIETVRSLGHEPFVARAGNGVIYHRGDLRSERTESPPELVRRVKEIFDPNRILPDIPT
jgi:FAD/FMN-containing dehydrogenase